jgi:hypothetical protein
MARKLKVLAFVNIAVLLVFAVLAAGRGAPVSSAFAWDMKVAVDAQLVGSDGAQIGAVTFTRPVASGDSAAAEAANAVYDALEERMRAFMADTLAEYDAGKPDAMHLSVSRGVGCAYKVSCDAALAAGDVVSFVSREEYSNFGYKANEHVYAHTFIVNQGREADISDFLAVDEANVHDTLLAEYKRVFDRAGMGEFKDAWLMGIYDESGLDAVFWLAEDGVHVYFNQPPGQGAPALDVVVPYYRRDLVRPDALALLGKAGFNAHS